MNKQLKENRPPLRLRQLVANEIIARDEAARSAERLKSEQSQPVYEIITEGEALALMDRTRQREEIIRCLALTRQYVIMPLDMTDIDEAFEIVDTYWPYVAGFKIGNTLQASFMISKRSIKALVGRIKSHGCLVFYDGKSHDIKETMLNTAKKVIDDLGPDFYNLHGAASDEAIAAVVEARMETIILGVSALTDLSDEQCVERFGVPREEAVCRFAEILLKMQVQGIICSGLELIMLSKDSRFDQFVKMVPGVRPPWSAKNDQKAISTPEAVIRNGATLAVIGRPISKPENEIGSPFFALYLIGKEIAKALAYN